jgi:DNA-binding transcriptional MocR family regulator
LLDEGNVNLTPGSACRIAEPGFFRLCYAALPVEHVVEGIERVGELLVTGT